MKNRNLFIALPLLLVLLYSCKKKAGVQEEPANQQCFADLLASEQYSAEYTEAYKTNTMPLCDIDHQKKPLGNYYYSYLCINPNNTNQIAFIRCKIENGRLSQLTELCTYDACTKILRVIASNPFYTPDWSTKGWIIYTATDLQLYKVKANGDSVTKLTNTGNYNNHAKWSPDGSTYLYHDVSNRKMRISRANGDLIQYINLAAADWEYINEDEIIYSGGGESSFDIYKYKISTDEKIILSSNEGISNMGTRINVVNQIAYLHLVSGVYKFELSSNKLSLIDSSYKSYYAFDPLPVDHDNFILNRLKSDSTDFLGCTLYFHSYISIFNSRTKTERYLKLPE